MQKFPWMRAALILPLGFSLACLGNGGGDEDASNGPWPGMLPAGGGVDSDGDGLSDIEEEELGSDPDNPDSDGDGWMDGEEVAQFTDPTKKKDHPYTGGWDIGECRHDLNGEGQDMGDIANNFELVDQWGDPLKLHDFCHKEVLLVASAFW